MKRIDSLNLIPFIDVSLVLLVIVLVSVSFIEKGNIKVELAETKNFDNLNNYGFVYKIEINKQNQYFFESELVTVAELSQKLKKTSKDAVFHIYIGKEVIFQNFIKVVETLKKEKLNNFTIISKQN